MVGHRIVYYSRLRLIRTCYCCNLLCYYTIEEELTVLHLIQPLVATLHSHMVVIKPILARDLHFLMVGHHIVYYSHLRLIRTCYGCNLLCYYTIEEELTVHHLIQPLVATLYSHMVVIKPILALELHFLMVGHRIVYYSHLRLIRTCYCYNLLCYYTIEEKLPVLHLIQPLVATLYSHMVSW